MSFLIRAEWNLGLARQVKNLWFVVSLFVGIIVAGWMDQRSALAAAPNQTIPWPEIRLERLVAANQPVQVVDPGDGSGRLFVVEKGGTIHILVNGEYLERPFLDIRSLVEDDGERGLLSMALPPDFETSRVFYIYYNIVEDLLDPQDEPNGGSDSVIARYSLSDDDNIADPNSEERILVVNQPYTNHNGGLLRFGPDGYLYIGLGDGGSAGDPLNAGQRRNTLLGKILRIAVDPQSPELYTIPEDNPFVGSNDARPEIWAYGLRNPWQYSFDRETGDLYIGDVGQGDYEEINFQPADSSGGENYGWRIMEGLHCFGASSCNQNGLILPIHEYAHDDPNSDRTHGSVTGGVVYRGAVRAGQGIYFFADYESGVIWGLQRDGDEWVVHEFLDTNLGIASFGEAADGEIFVVDLRGSIHRLIINESFTHSLYVPYISQPVEPSRSNQ